LNLEIKGIDIAGESLNSYLPDEPGHFSIWITINVGFVGEDGGTLFNLNVCTPSWIESQLTTGSEVGFWGYLTLVVSEYNANTIQELIVKKLLEISKKYSNTEPTELVELFSRYAYWEYQDYNE